MAESKISALRKFLDVLRYEKEDISSIYFFAIVNGLVQLSLPLGSQAIISFVLGGAISTSLILLITLVIIGVLLSGMLQVNQMKLIEKIQQQLFVRYSFQYAHIIPKLNLKDVDSYYLPELVNRFFDTVSLQKGISKLLLDIPISTIQIVFGLVLLSFYHPIFIFFGISLLIVLYLILSTTGSQGLKTSVEESNFKYQVAGYLEELARGVTTFKFSRSSSLHLNKTDEYLTGYLKARTSHFKILLFQYATLVGFKVLITAAMLIVGAYLLVNQKLNIGQFIAAELVILMIIGSVEKIIVSLDKVYDVLTSVEKITKVTDKPTEKTGDLELGQHNQLVSLQVKNLAFGYTSEKLVLKDISFEAKGGETIVIEGPFSSGKSTLLKVLSGAYSSFSGNYLINNIPLTNYDINSLRAQSGVMLHLQDIFQGTLKENICLGDDRITFEQLDSLANVVGLKPFIDAQQDGYNLELQPSGQKLPGRMVKKILLMRALVHNPKLLLLEEPWLGLEDDYQQQIQDYLLNNLGETTKIIVTNDNSFTTKSDQIITMANGTIVSIRKNKNEGN